jgi:hypothetical protein
MGMDGSSPLMADQEAKGEETENPCCTVSSRSLQVNALVAD